MIKISKKGKVVEEEKTLTLREVMTASKEKTMASAKRKMAKNKTHASSFGAIWLSSVKNAGFAVPMITATCCTILKACAKRYSEFTRMRSDLPEFGVLLVWSVDNWSIIMASHFKKMTDPPSIPALRLWVACINQFATLWIDREKLNKRKSMSTREQLIEENLDRGQNREAAERSADEKLGLVKLKEEIKQERQKLQQVQNTTPRFNAVQCREAMAKAKVVEAQQPKVVEAQQPKDEEKKVGKEVGKGVEQKVGKAGVRVRVRIPIELAKLGNPKTDISINIPRWED